MAGGYNGRRDCKFHSNGRRYLGACRARGLANLGRSSRLHRLELRLLVLGWGHPMTGRVAYRITEFAEAIGVDRVTVWRWIRAGKLETIKVAGMTLVPIHVLTHAAGRYSVLPPNTQRSPVRELKPWEGKRNAT